MTAEGWAAIPNWMVRDPEIKPNALAVYAVIQSHAGAKGTTALRHATIAQEAGVSKDSVKRALQQLKALGVLWWEGTKHAGGFGANVYHPLQERREDVVESSHLPHPERKSGSDPAPTPVQDSAETSGSTSSRVVESAPTPVQDLAPTPVQAGGVGAVSTQVGAVSTTKEEEPFKKNNPPAPRQVARPDDMGFSEFWAKYPPCEWKSKTSKTNLRGFWFGLTDDQRALALVALDAYVASAIWISKPGDIPGPKIFLENEPWLEAAANNLPAAPPPRAKLLTAADVRLTDEDD